MYTPLQGVVNEEKGEWESEFIWCVEKRIAVNGSKDIWESQWAAFA